MEDMISARYNVWWYLSFIVPALIMIAGTHRRNRVILVIAVIISLFTTYALCNLSVRKKKKNGTKDMKLLKHWKRWTMQRLMAQILFSLQYL
jgi:hypothetical protein